MTSSFFSIDERAVVDLVDRKRCRTCLEAIGRGGLSSVWRYGCLSLERPELCQGQSERSLWGRRLHPERVPSPPAPGGKAVAGRKGTSASRFRYIE